MKFHNVLTLSVCIILHSLSLRAQNLIIPFWNGAIPGAINNPSFHEETIKIENGQERIRKVTEPTISVYFPAKDKANGTAVIICPGGGYERLAFDHEGIQTAHWLNELGITGIVLKYRLPNDTIMVDKKVGPLQDVQEAIRYVRRHTSEWALHPDKIGVAGFSAGGHLAALASTKYDYNVYNSDSTSARPDFSILVYPVISMNSIFAHGGSKRKLLGSSPDSSITNFFSCELQTNTNTPPAFIVHAADDPSVPVQNSIAYFQALNRYKIATELHIYQKGGHGFGLAKNRGTESGWTEACKNWLKATNLIP